MQQEFIVGIRKVIETFRRLYSDIEVLPEGNETSSLNERIESCKSGVASLLAEAESFQEKCCKIGRELASVNTDLQRFQAHCKHDFGKDGMDPCDKCRLPPPPRASQMLHGGPMFPLGITHGQITRVGITFASQEDAPPCNECGSITVKNGACFKCLNCGASTEA